MLVLDVSAVQANNSKPRPLSRQLSIVVGALQHKNDCDRAIAHSPTQRSNRESAGQRFASLLQGTCYQQRLWLYTSRGPCTPCTLTFLLWRYSVSITSLRSACQGTQAGGNIAELSTFAQLAIDSGAASTNYQEKCA